MEKLWGFIYWMISRIIPSSWPDAIPNKHYEYDKIFGKNYTLVPELTANDFKAIRGFLKRDGIDRKILYSGIHTILGFLGRSYNLKLKNSLVDVETDFVYFRKYCLKIINQEFILMTPKQKYIYISLILEFLRLLSDLKMRSSVINERQILDLRIFIEALTSLAKISREPKLGEKREFSFASEINALNDGRQSFNVTEILDYVIVGCSIELTKNRFSNLQNIPLDYFQEIYQELIVYYKAKNDGLDSDFSFETKMNIYGIDPFWIENRKGI